MMNETENVHSIPEVEVETLHSIYLNELDVEYDDSESISSVGIQLYPATADKLEEQYVRMYLMLKLPEKYPHCIPEVYIRNPRGLSDEHINKIIENLLSIAENKKGTSMLFELIESAKEQLTAVNTPSEECAICLYGFLDGDVFTKTECYHYFHSHCLTRYIRSKLDEEKEENNKDNKGNTPCPVCRVPISFSGTEDEFPEPVAVSQAVVTLNQNGCNHQKEMARLYKKQLEQGGIIDLEAEKRKFLLEIANVPTDVVPKQSDIVPKQRDIVPKQSDIQLPGIPENNSSGIKAKTGTNAAFVQSKVPADESSDDVRDKESYNSKYRYPNRKTYDRPRQPYRNWRPASYEKNVKQHITEDKGISCEDVVQEKPKSDEECTTPSDFKSRRDHIASFNLGKGKEINSDTIESDSVSKDKRYSGHQNYNRNYLPRNGQDGYRNRYGNPRNPRFRGNNFRPRGVHADVYKTNKEENYPEGNKHDDNGDNEETVLSFQNEKTAHEKDNFSKTERKKPFPYNSKFKKYDRPAYPRHRQQFSQERGGYKRFSRNADESAETPVVLSAENEASANGRDTATNYRNKSDSVQQPHSGRSYQDRQANGRSRFNRSYSRNNYSNSQSVSHSKYGSVMKDSFVHEKSRSVRSSDLQSKAEKPINVVQDVTKNSQDISTHRHVSDCSTMEIRSHKESVGENRSTKADVYNFKELKGSNALEGPNTGIMRSPPGFANPSKKVVYGLPSVNPPPGFRRS